jgi:ribosomal protein S18 acetylase RimI-like enzyme
MIEIRSLDSLTLDDLHRVASGYVSDHEYRLIHNESLESITFDLRLVPLEQPYIKKYSFDADTMAVYEPLLGNDFCLGVYDGDLLVGLAICEVHFWNNSLWVHEFHIAEKYRGQGLGRRLMHRICHVATKQGVRLVVCETQNKNAPAIAAYFKMNFHLDGVELSYYLISDHPEGEFAVFMKRRIE